MPAPDQTPQAMAVAGCPAARRRGEAIEEGVGGGVGALADTAPGGGAGGEEDAGVQRSGTEQGVEVAGTGDLAGEHPAPFLGVEGGDGPLAVDAGQVEDATQRRASFVDRVEQRGDGAALGQVAGDHGGGGPEGLDLGDLLGDAGGSRAATAGQYDALGAMRDQPTGECLGDAAGAAGDQGGAGGVPACRDRRLFAQQATGKRPARAQGDLVLVAGEESAQWRERRGIECRRQIDQPAPVRRVFQAHDLAESPDHRLPGVRDGLASGDRVTGDEPQAAVLGQIVDEAGQGGGGGEATLRRQVSLRGCRSIQGQQ